MYPSAPSRARRTRTHTRTTTTFYLPRRTFTTAALQARAAAHEAAQRHAAAGTRAFPLPYGISSVCNNILLSSPLSLSCYSSVVGILWYRHSFMCLFTMPAGSCCTQALLTCSSSDTRRIEPCYVCLLLYCLRTLHTALLQQLSHDELFYLQVLDTFIMLAACTYSSHYFV